MAGYKRTVLSPRINFQVQTNLSLRLVSGFHKYRRHLQFEVEFVCLPCLPSVPVQAFILLNLF